MWHKQHYYDYGDVNKVSLRMNPNELGEVSLIKL